MNNQLMRKKQRQEIKVKNSEFLELSRKIRQTNNTKKRRELSKELIGVAKEMKKMLEDN